MLRAISLNPDGSPAAMRQTVQAAEAAGFDTAYVSDLGTGREVFTVLADLAAHTRRLRLGTGITYPYTRSPVVLAAAVATLDELSGGRGFLGLGAGGAETLQRMGLARANPVQACRETAEIVRRLWRGETVHYAGQVFQVNGARLDCPARPDIELHWGARGARMLALAGAVADVVLLNGLPATELGAITANVRAAAEAAGRTVRFVYALPLVYDDESRATARRRMTWRLASLSAEAKARVGVGPGVEAAIADALRRDGPQAAADLISDDVLAHFVLADGPAAAGWLRRLMTDYALHGFVIEIAQHDTAPALLARAQRILDGVQSLP